jgi:hypothetical protein
LSWQEKLDLNEAKLKELQPSDVCKNRTMPGNDAVSKQMEPDMRIANRWAQIHELEARQEALRRAQEHQLDLLRGRFEAAVLQLTKGKSKELKPIGDEIAHLEQMLKKR